MNNLINIISKIRASLNRLLFPAKGYWTATKTVKPLSTKFGYDRGKPIDRFWIENFLEENKKHIKGTCLEITDNAYTVRYGKNKVVKSDVLDVDINNKKANVHGDLRDLTKVVGSNSYDCILLTHVLGLIDEIDRAIAECYRILKPGGTILVTSACIAPSYDLKSNYWRFTPQGAKYLFEKKFAQKNVQISTYGNALTGQCFWVGMSQEDVTLEQLEFNDPRFPCIVAVKATKERE